MNNEIRISVGGGEEPKWLPDGSGVYYRNGSVDEGVVGSREEPKVGKPELFFEGDYVNVWGLPGLFRMVYLLLELEEWVQPTEIDVIINALDLTLEVSLTESFQGVHIDLDAEARFFGDGQFSVNQLQIVLDEFLPELGVG